MKLLQGVLFSRKYAYHLCRGYVKQEAPKKQHKGRQAALLLLCKQVPDETGIAESLHAQITRAID